MSDSQLSIGAALGYAWSLWRSHWREVWAAFALNALACTVLCAGLFAQNLGLIAGGMVALLFTRYVVYGSIYRLALQPDHSGDDNFRVGALGLQWRKAELRMFGAGVLIFVFCSIIAILIAIAVVAVVGGVMYSRGIDLASAVRAGDAFKVLGDTGEQIRRAGYDLILLVLTVIEVRLSLAFAATVDTGRVSVFRTWKLTRGNFWRIFASTLVIELPSAMIMMLGVGAGLSLEGRPAPLAPGETFLYSLICGGWAGAAAMPLAAGVQAYFYRNLKTAD